MATNSKNTSNHSYDKEAIKPCLELCPKLKIIFITFTSVFWNQDKVLFPKLEHIGTHFSIYSTDKLNKLKILADKYSQTIKSLNVILSNLTKEELKTFIECIARFENLKELTLRLVWFEYSEPLKVGLSLIGQKCNKLLKLDLDIHECDPISERFFDAFLEFKAIEKLRIRCD